MGLSLKQEEMLEFLEAAKTESESFSVMLWGTAYASASKFQDRSAASNMIIGEGGGGVVGSVNNAFCYIGLTDQCLYAIAVDSYNTSKVIGTIKVPFAQITSLNVRKAAFGASHTVEVSFGDDFVSLTVKSTSVGTNIKDQKERMNAFLSQVEALKR